MLNASLIFCGALPVVLVVFCFLATSKRVRQADRREFVPTYSSEGGGYSCSCSFFFCCLWCAFWFLHFHSAPSKWAARSGIYFCTNESYTSGLCRYSLLGCMTCILLSPSTCPCEAVARNATTVCTAASYFSTHSCGLHRLEPHEKSAHAHAGTSLNSIVVVSIHFVLCCPASVGATP